TSRPFPPRNSPAIAPPYGAALRSLLCIPCNHFSRSGPVTRSAAAGPRSCRPTGRWGISRSALPWLGVYGRATASHRRGAGCPPAACGALSSLLLNVTCGLTLLDSHPSVGGRNARKDARRRSQRRAFDHARAHGESGLLHRRPLRRGRV